MLSFADGSPFASGATSFGIRPARAAERHGRMILDVQIEGFQTEAMLDTGGIFLVCHPELAEFLDLGQRESVGTEILNIRGHRVGGRLFRLELTLVADQGSDLTIEATAFIADLWQGEEWSLPTILGWHGCLERVRLAIDPDAEVLYFGHA